MSETHAHMIKTIIVLLACLWLMASCGRVRAYQAHATEKCEAKHSKEECRPVSYPSCHSGNFGGQECQ